MAWNAAGVCSWYCEPRGPLCWALHTYTGTQSRVCLLRRGAGSGAHWGQDRLCLLGTGYDQIIMMTSSLFTWDWFHLLPYPSVLPCFSSVSLPLVFPLNIPSDLIRSSASHSTVPLKQYSCWSVRWPKGPHWLTHHHDVARMWRQCWGRHFSDQVIWRFGLSWWAFSVLIVLLQWVLE